MPEADKKDGEQYGLRRDWAMLVKLRLNVFVLITTFFGYLLKKGAGAIWGVELIHVLFGTAACAFAASVFNQMAEVDSDAMMERTADRPLPARRVKMMTAFIAGVVLVVFGSAHLWVKVGHLTGLLALATVVVYVFVYTPLKKVSSLNTLVGAIPGAIPPLIGWVAAGGALTELGGWYLFALLFIWQLPHFVAINWLCREEYERAGYVMWSDGDVGGGRSAKLAAWFSWGLVVWACLSLFLDFIAWWFAPVGMLLGGGLVISAMRFSQTGERKDFRKLFLGTLLYLPLVLIALSIVWCR